MKNQKIENLVIKKMLNYISRFFLYNCLHKFKKIRELQIKNKFYKLNVLKQKNREIIFIYYII